MGEIETPSVPVDAVPELLAPDVVLLDVREPDEWELGHAPGALHIPLEDVPARLAEIDIDAVLYVICRQGGRSRIAAEYLNNLGYEAANVAGGMVAWQQAGRPLTSTAGPEAKIY